MVDGWLDRRRQLLIDDDASTRLITATPLRQRHLVTPVVLRNDVTMQVQLLSTCELYARSQGVKPTEVLVIGATGGIVAATAAAGGITVKQRCTTQPLSEF